MMGIWLNDNGIMINWWWEHVWPMMEIWLIDDRNMNFSMMGKWLIDDENMTNRWWEHDSIDDGNMSNRWWEYN